MFPQERLDKIMEILYRDGRVVVKDLSKIFGVSEDSIRKDLKSLENNKLIERIYGGAILKNQIPKFTMVGERKEDNIESKRIIAKKAFRSIKNKETIFLDISSINIILSQMLAESKLDITVISNSIDVLYNLSGKSNIQVVCPGGILYQDVGGFVGSATIEAIEKYKAQKVFIGSCGVDIRENNVSTFNIEDGNTKKAIINSGKEVILVMENMKFFYEGTYKFADMNRIDTIITEEEPSPTIISKLNKYKIKLI